MNFIISYFSFLVSFRLPKPVFAKPLTQNDDEDGITEESLERLQGIQQ